MLLGVNFINVLRTNFSYERRFSSYILDLSKNLYEKFSSLTLMKLMVGGNFINSICAHFLYESAFLSTKFGTFWQKVPSYKKKCA